MPNSALEPHRVVTQHALEMAKLERSPPYGSESKTANTDKAFEAGEGPHGCQSKHPTTYVESLIHFLKGNVGSGIFALGEGFKYAGIILGPILTITLGLFCLYCEHLLVSSSVTLKERLKLPNYPQFADTIRLGFENGPPWIRGLAKYAKPLVNVSIITAHLGFCCVYLIFISSTSQVVMNLYGIDLNLRLHMVILLFPLLLSAMVRSLKFLVPMSLVANICIGFGIITTVYMIGSDLPPISSRRYVGDFSKICLFYGTAMYSFEGIGLVLPLKIEMKKPEQFDGTFGVLNVGMAIIITLFTLMGFLGYLRFGEDIASSITLSLPPEEKLSQLIQISIGIGIFFTYALMFYVAILIIWPFCEKKLGPFKRPLLAELLCRICIVFLTFFLSEVIPHLGLFISLVGACSTTALALGVPPLCDIALRWPSNFGVLYWRLILDTLALVVGFIGFVTGTYFSLAAIFQAFFEPVL